MSAANTTTTPDVVSREAWQARIDELRVREKAHTREGDAIAAARRRLPMTEVDPSTPLAGPGGELTLLDAFEGRSQLFATFHMWHAGRPAAGQCEGCTFFTGQVTELSAFHQRDVTYAVFCQGPFDASDRYRRFMGWEVPWYSVPALLAGRHFGMKVAYLRDGDRVFETYWTTGRGAEAMAPAYAVLDMMVYGRQERWEDSPAGWPQPYDATAGDQFRLDGRPSAQWARLAAGHGDDLGDGAPAAAHGGDGGCCH
jgi:predicted dithiol-disulfide oxidoreductase (DUF899 family)